MIYVSILNKLQHMQADQAVTAENHPGKGKRKPK